MYSLEQFLNNKLSLAIHQNGQVIYKSQESALKPLIQYIKLYGFSKKKLQIYDKYTGRAAALLFSLIRPFNISTSVISKSAEEVLKRDNIPYKALKKVDFLMDIASEDMCKWEKMASKCTASEFWNLVKNQ